MLDENRQSTGAWLDPVILGSILCSCQPLCFLLIPSKSAEYKIFHLFGRRDFVFTNVPSHATHSHATHPHATHSHATHSHATHNHTPTCCTRSHTHMLHTITHPHAAHPDATHNHTLTCYTRSHTHMLHTQMLHISSC